MKSLIIMILSLLVMDAGKAQTLKGIVYEMGENQNKIPLIGTNIFWEGTQIGTTTNEEGFFELEKNESDHLHLIVSYIGYQPDTVEVSPEQDNIEIVLSVNRELKEVVVTGTSLSKYLDRDVPVTTTSFNSLFTYKTISMLSCSGETSTVSGW